MDDNLGSCGSLPPFLSKLYEMVDDLSTDLVVSWSESNKSFVVWNQPEFSQVLLPKYFKHNNFSSFIRQLNTYGFRKIDPEKWEFANDDFVRGRPHLLKNIHRRKPVHSHSGKNVEKQAPVSPLTESERQCLKDDIERLKTEKESLLLDVQKQEEERAELDNQIQSLKNRFHLMEQRHKNVISNLADLLQKPGLALTILFHSESTDRKRRLPRVSYLQDEGNGEESATGMSQVSDKENRDEASSGILSIVDLYDLLESSLTLWENIMSHAHQTFDDRVSNSNNLELDEATSCAEDPAIDMNLTMAASEPPESVIPSKEQVVANPVTTGVNDVFWEQFLTEDPGSSGNQEVQSVRMDNIEGKNSTAGRYWWNSRAVNNLAEQMGHLTPAERT